MGWAKYYEDNVSIYIGRIALKDPASPYSMLERSPMSSSIAENQIKAVEADRVRRGLELMFQNGIEDRMITKLQMNGWWWSKSKACWCNHNTPGNRKIADYYTHNMGAKLVAVA